MPHRQTALRRSHHQSGSPREHPWGQEVISSNLVDGQHSSKCRDHPTVPDERWSVRRAVTSKHSAKSGELCSSVRALPLQSPHQDIIILCSCKQTMTRPDTGPEPTIVVQNLSYSFPDGSNGLKNVALDLPAGSRTLLIGGMAVSAAAFRQFLSIWNSFYAFA